MEKFIKRYFEPIYDKIKDSKKTWYTDQLKNYMELLKHAPKDTKTKNSLKESAKDISRECDSLLKGEDISGINLEIAISAMLNNLPYCYYDTFLVHKSLIYTKFEVNLTKQELNNLVDYLIKVLSGEIFSSQNPVDVCLVSVLRQNTTYCNLNLLFNSITKGKVTMLSNDYRRLEPSKDYYGFMEKIVEDLDKIWVMDRNEWMKEYLLKQFEYGKKDKKYSADLSDVIQKVYDKIYELKNIIDWLIINKWDNRNPESIVKNVNEYILIKGTVPEHKGFMLHMMISSNTKVVMIRKIKSFYQEVRADRKWDNALGSIEEYVNGLYTVYENKSRYKYMSDYYYRTLYLGYCDQFLPKLIRHHVLNNSIDMNNGDNGVENLLHNIDAVLMPATLDLVYSIVMSK